MAENGAVKDGGVIAPDGNASVVNEGGGSNVGAASEAPQKSAVEGGNPAANLEGGARTGQVESSGNQTAQEESTPRKRPLDTVESGENDKKRPTMNPSAVPESAGVPEDNAAPAQDLGNGTARQNVSVPKEAVGFVIGKGGETIKELMQRSGAHIEVDRAEASTTSAVRYFFVTGTPAQIELAKVLIQEKVAGVLHNKAEVPVEPTSGSTNIEVWVPLDRVGMIIGSGGQVIKQLQERSKATIVVHNDKVSPNGEKLVTIVGGPAESEAARTLVQEIMNKPKPNNAQMAMPMQPVQQQQPAQQPQQQAAYGHTMYGPSSATSGYSGYPMYGAVQMPQMGGSGNTTKMVTVPNSVVGIVIGKQGETIKDLQHRSGAHVKVTPDKETPKGSTERSITISGSEEAVRLAHNLLNDIVNEALARGSGGGAGGAGGGAKMYPPGGSSVPNQMSPNYPSSSISETLHVPNDKVGLVIGKGGQTIRELQQRSGARIVVAKEVEANSERNTRPVTVTGPKNFVDQAKALIQEKISSYYQPQQGYNQYAVQPGFGYQGQQASGYTGYDPNVVGGYSYDPAGYAAAAAAAAAGDQQAQAAQAQMYYQMYAYGAYPQTPTPGMNADQRGGSNQRQQFPSGFPGGTSQPGPPRH